VPLTRPRGPPWIFSPLSRSAPDPAAGRRARDAARGPLGPRAPLFLWRCWPLRKQLTAAEGNRRPWPSADETPTLPGDQSCCLASLRPGPLPVGGVPRKRKLSARQTPRSRPGGCLRGRLPPKRPCTWFQTSESPPAEAAGAGPPRRPLHNAVAWPAPAFQKPPPRPRDCLPEIHALAVCCSRWDQIHQAGGAPVARIGAPNHPSGACDLGSTPITVVTGGRPRRLLAGGPSCAAAGVPRKRPQRCRCTPDRPVRAEPPLRGLPPRAARSDGLRLVPAWRSDCPTGPAEISRERRANGLLLPPDAEATQLPACLYPADG